MVQKTATLGKDRLYRTIESLRVPHIAALAAAHLAVGLAVLLFPQALKRFVDAAGPGGAPALALAWALAYLCIGVGYELLQIAKTWIVELTKGKAVAAAQARVTRRMLDAYPAGRGGLEAGALVETLDGDVDAVLGYRSSVRFETAGSILVLAGSVAAMAREDWRLALAAVGYAAAVGVLAASTGSAGVAAAGKRRAAASKLFGFIEESIGGAEAIHAAGAADARVADLRGLVRRHVGASRGALVANKTLQQAFRLLNAASYALLLGLLWLGWRRSALEAGSAFLAVSYFKSLDGSVFQIAGARSARQSFLASRDRLAELADSFGSAPATESGPDRTASRAPDAGGDGGPAPRLSIPPEIRFDRVSFSYVEGTPTLHDVSFVLAPGTVTGLVGRTGSGKSTVARLLFGFLAPASGRVLVDGADLDDLTRRDGPSAWRRRVAFVSQDSPVFPATLRENLSMFDPGVPDARILEAVGNLGLSEWFSRFSGGLDAPVDAAALAGGDAQLVALVRAALREPDFLLLDEATSRVDPRTERLLKESEGILSRRATTLVVAHRPSTVSDADAVIVMEDGAIVEAGAPASLERDPGSRWNALLRAREGEDDHAA
ncbi:MAG: ABC transporter ATP-binding protein [Spirochaetia bacterium]|nr:ABC transporter ATP-binding protein [Spirochaetia bacterium]